MVQPSQQHVAPCVKGVGIGHEMFENDGSVLGHHPGRGYRGCRHSPTLQTRCHRDTLLVSSCNTQGYGGHILPPTHRGKIDYKCYKIVS